ncbi:MAG: hypothetical protein QNJ94_19145 [Alphaproteobacteria bacterium]|nr:hypothetical protein [Alphaproteobacteria bacterium]
MEKLRRPPRSFEETYAQYPFAELVRLGIGVARQIAQLRRQLRRRSYGQQAGTLNNSGATTARDQVTL